MIERPIRWAAAAAAAAFGLARLADRAAAQNADTGDGSTALDYANPWGAIERQVDGARAARDATDQNVAAMLTMIAWAEGTEREPDPYRVCFGYRHVIADLRDHPAITGEWRGERLSDAMCRAAGFGPGCVSTAAGRYQIIRPTWATLKRALGLPDFGAQSQDRAAVELLRRRGALEHAKAGRVREAIAAARQEWASLPGNTAGQPQRATDDLVAVYEQAGGMVA